MEGESETQTQRQTQTQTGAEKYQGKSHRSHRRGSRPVLPGVVIRDGILSYRPFRSLKVVLVRGSAARSKPDQGGGCDPFRKGCGFPAGQNYHGDASSLHSCYALTFSTNRGPLRFEVFEMPYLPPRRRNHESPVFPGERAPGSRFLRGNHPATKDGIGNGIGIGCDYDYDYDAVYRDADGVVVSCFIARFFEFCDRYGYDYASSSILADVVSRAGRTPPPGGRTSGSGTRTRPHPHPNPYPNPYPRPNPPKNTTVVLCGNTTDVTLAEARLSCVVVRDQARAAEADRANPTGSFIDGPGHPFASLARAVTGDGGLSFGVFGSGLGGEPATPEGRSRSSFCSGENDDRIQHEHALHWNRLRARVDS
ncbi:unnamed protein product [Pseudo-nitzschia multistriata]|uniref:Uncharacterized protein n=1 Tax=Pseudo-nitzschia multistriata TaxID=183589 RepID=A0A448ZQS6_9STRA|nr:unnamed protein product [Pseudo-nitzschia multistriata]